MQAEAVEVLRTKLPEIERVARARFGPAAVDAVKVLVLLSVYKVLVLFRLSSSFIAWLWVWGLLFSGASARS